MPDPVVRFFVLQKSSISRRDKDLSNHGIGCIHFGYGRRIRALG